MNSKVYIYQDGNIPGERIIEELERRGGLNDGRWDGDANALYYIDTDMHIKGTFSKAKIPEGYSELHYSPDNDTFYETDSQRMQSARAKEALLPDDVRKVNVMEKDGTFEVNIPEGYEATVEEGKVVIRKHVWKPKVGDKCYYIRPCADTMRFYVDLLLIEEEEDIDFYDGGWLFETEGEARAFYNRINEVIKPLAEERRKELGL